MNRSDKTDDSAHHDDVQAIFDAQSFDVPAELDARILAAAHSEGENPQASGAVPIVPVQWAKPLLAIAATLIIGVGIVPRVLQSPDATSEPANDRPVVEGIPAPMAADGLESMQQNPSTRESPAVSAVQSHDRAEKAGNADMTLVPSRQTDKAQDTSALTRQRNNAVTLEESSTTTATMADEVRPHQRSAEDWLAYIESMIERGEKQAAREEFERFREIFPEFKPPDLFAND